MVFLSLLLENMEGPRGAPDNPIGSSLLLPASLGLIAATQCPLITGMDYPSQQDIPFLAKIASLNFQFNKTDAIFPCRSTPPLRTKATTELNILGIESKNAVKSLSTIMEEPFLLLPLILGPIYFGVGKNSTIYSSPIYPLRCFPHWRINSVFCWSLHHACRPGCF